MNQTAGARPARDLRAGLCLAQSAVGSGCCRSPRSAGHTRLAAQTETQATRTVSSPGSRLPAAERQAFLRAAQMLSTLPTEEIAIPGRRAARRSSTREETQPTTQNRLICVTPGRKTRTATRRAPVPCSPGGLTAPPTPPARPRPQPRQLHGSLQRCRHGGHLPPSTPQHPPGIRHPGYSESPQTHSRSASEPSPPRDKNQHACRHPAKPSTCPQERGDRAQPASTTGITHSDQQWRHRRSETHAYRRV